VGTGQVLANSLQGGDGGDAGTGSTTGVLGGAGGLGGKGGKVTVTPLGAGSVSNDVSNGTPGKAGANH